jgi:hypothetical protein
MPLFFNAAQLPQAGAEYVAWLDVMGTQSSMSRSLNATANFIFKLHAAALQAPKTGMQLYPVMDGVYAASATQSAMLDFLRIVLAQVAEEFNQTTQPLHRFIVRGGLAFGPVIHGNSIPQLASPVLAENAAYRGSVLLGMPMVQAHLSEATAPPFGIAVHESARVFALPGQSPIHTVWWKWANTANQATWTALQTELPAHLKWCSERSMWLNYPADRITVHRQMVEQYFSL